MEKIKELLTKWFKSNPKPYKRQIKDVRIGEYIQVELDKAVGKLVNVECLNNDSASKQILIEVVWENYKEVVNTMRKERIILKYGSKELKNFNLLNNSQNKDLNFKCPNEKIQIKHLLLEMNDALEKEEYEKAAELKIKINEILG